MCDPGALRKPAGSWTGKKQVLLAGELRHESPSTLAITPIVGGRFVQLAYAWAFDGDAQEGVLIVGFEAAENAITAVWLDSWHMGDRIIHLRGPADDHAIELRGNCAVADSPNRGRRLALKPDRHKLHIAM